MSSDITDRFTCAGTPDEVVQQIRDNVVPSGFSHVIFLLSDPYLVEKWSGLQIGNVPDLVGQLRLIHEQIMPAFARQQAASGLMGLSDFTHPDDVISVAGEPFPHLLYQFRFAYSGWRSVMVVRGGESYTALAEGLQQALRRLAVLPKSTAPTVSVRRPPTSAFSSTWQSDSIVE